MRWSLILVMCAMPTLARAQIDSTSHRGEQLCWRGKPAPACDTFWITELSVQYPYATTWTRYTYVGTYVNSYSRQDVSTQVFWTVGPMFNTNSNRALGVTVSAGFVHDGSRVAVEARRRYWTAERSAFDFTLGGVRMNAPPVPGHYQQHSYGLTGGAYMVGSDQIHVNGRADLLVSDGRVRAGGTVGAGLGTYGAIGATIVLGALIGAVAIVLAHAGGDF
jgi:hypothetical protein